MTYIYTTYIVTYIHSYIHTCIHTYIHTYIYIHIYNICTYICTYIHTYVYTYTYVHTYICTYIHMYIHTHIHIHTYIFLFLAKAGRISPTGSLTYNRYDSDNSYGWGRVPEPTYMSNPHWWRYRDKHCCHPKNTCHFCFYRDTFWTGYREANSHKWYNCKETGFLRCLLLIWMWCLIWPCACVGLCIWGCFMLCFFCCCYEDDD